MLLKCVNTGSQNGNCYILGNDAEALILDAGVRYKDVLKALDYNISKVTGLLLTHEHGDHTKSLKEFVRSGIPVYGCDELQDTLEVIHGEKITGWIEKRPHRVGKFWITPFYLPHDNTPNFGFLIDFPDGAGRLLYATDFEYLPYTFKSLKINYFLLECNHQADLVDRSEAKYEHSLRGHSELETVKEIIRVNKTSDMRNVILCHLSGGWSDPETMQKEVQSVAGKWVNVDVAHAGMELKMSKYPF